MHLYLWKIFCHSKEFKYAIKNELSHTIYNKNSTLKGLISAVHLLLPNQECSQMKMYTALLIKKKKYHTIKQILAIKMAAGRQNCTQGFTHFHE